MLPQRYRPHRTDQPLPQTNSCHNTISPTRIQEPAHTTPSLTIETSYPPTGAENGTSVGARLSASRSRCSPASQPAGGRAWGVCAVAQEALGAVDVVLDGVPGERLEDRVDEDPPVGVIAVGVLGHRRAEPREVALVRGLPRPACAGRLVVFGHLGEAVEQEA